MILAAGQPRPCGRNCDLPAWAFFAYQEVTDCKHFMAGKCFTFITVQTVPRFMNTQLCSVITAGKVSILIGQDKGSRDRSGIEP